LSKHTDYTELPGSMPPAKLLLRISSSIRLHRALWISAQLGVADYLESARDHPRGEKAEGVGDQNRDEPITPVPVETLAREVGAEKNALYRVLRALASEGIFTEPAPRAFIHTRYSEPLRSDAPDSVRDVILQHGDEPEWRAWGSMLHTIKTGEPAFEYVWGESPWRMYEDTRARMTQISQRDSKALAEHPLFRRAKHIVDVAGGEGNFLASVLKANPYAVGTLFDRPTIVDSARALLDLAGVNDRCTIVGGDMFQSIPHSGDLYILKRTLHDWDDEHVLAILGSLQKAMRGKGRLVILTEIIEPGNSPSSAKLSDLTLMVMLGGRHRTAQEFYDLIEACGFVTEDFVELPSTLSAIVAVPRNND